MRRMKRKGLTLIEVILVLVVVATIAGLAAPNLRIGMENRRAKQALETLRSIHHAVRMYEVNKGVLPASIAVLQQEGYLSTVEFSVRAVTWLDSRGYQYTINTTNPANWFVKAERAIGFGCGQRVFRTLQMFRNGQTSDCPVNLYSYPAPAACPS